MTNYEKYAGTPEMFARFIVKQDSIGFDGDSLAREYCRNTCGCGIQGAAQLDCAHCILTWLREEAK